MRTTSCPERQVSAPASSATAQCSTSSSRLQGKRGHGGPFQLTVLPLQLTVVPPVRAVRMSELRSPQALPAACSLQPAACGRCGPVRAGGHGRRWPALPARGRAARVRLLGGASSRTHGYGQDPTWYCSSAAFTATLGGVEGLSWRLLAEDHFLHGSARAQCRSPSTPSRPHRYGTGRARSRRRRSGPEASLARSWADTDFSLAISPFCEAQL